MLKTYESIATYTVPSSQSSVTFSSIPQTFTDLVLVTTVITTTGTIADLRTRINSDAGNNYSRIVMSANGSAVGTGQNVNVPYAYGMLSTSSNWTTNTMHFMNYSNTTTFKTILFRGNDTAVQTTAGVDLWRSQTAITNLVFDNNIGDFITGSTLTLYGIKAA